MSLDWDVSRVSDDTRLVRDEETGEMVMSPITNALIWATLSTGIGEITEKSAREFYVRAHAWEIVFGAALREVPEGDGPAVPRYLTPADVQAHIGLRTNVFPYETPTKWRAKLARAVERIGEDRWREAERHDREVRDALSAATD